MTLPQSRHHATVIPGPESLALQVHKEAAVSAGVSTLDIITSAFSEQ